MIELAVGVVLSIALFSVVGAGFVIFFGDYFK